jgi:serine/threonine protein kinase
MHVCYAQEARILSRTNHPNVVKFFGASFRDPVFIVEELLRSDLQALIHSNDLLPLDDVLRCVKATTCGCRNTRSACLLLAATPSSHTLPRT